MNKANPVGVRVLVARVLDLSDNRHIKLGRCPSCHTRYDRASVRHLCGSCRTPLPQPARHREPLTKVAL